MDLVALLNGLPLVAAVGGVWGIALLGMIGLVAWGIAASRA